MSSSAIDLHRISRIANRLIWALTIAFFMAGWKIHFAFHFLTVFFLMLTVMNFFYRRVQTRHAILRNFGILGQARYILEGLGPELRQYLFSNDTEERPFNRVERSEIYRKAKGIDSAMSFGSALNYDATEIKIRHSMYPTPKEELAPFRVTVGEERGLDSAYTLTRPVMVSAMSFGALGATAVQALGRGARMAGVAMNTGEGGYPKYHLMSGADLIFQMGTAKFGVRTGDALLDDAKLRDLAARPEIKMVEIKFSQGAKPGKGGLLPKEKISKEISELRGVPMGQDVVSPPYHAECRTPAAAVAFIQRVQEVSGVPVGIKFCVGCLTETRTLFEEMAKQGIYPDYIAIDGGEGGTGAAPKPYLDGFGMPLLPALCKVQRQLVEVGIRDKLKVFSAGKMINAAKWVHGLSLGADAIYTARGFMFALGCIQALQCGNNTCPVGLTTHDPDLQRGLVIEDKARRVKNYVDGVYHDFEELCLSVGVKSATELSPRNIYVPPASIIVDDVPAQC